MENCDLEESTKFTIIVLSYNSTLRTILLTLKSIIMQEMKEIEIIIADDGSKIQWKKEIEEFFNKHNFSKYYFAPSNQNVGTVKNILRAIEFGKGRYVKCIGAGDYLFDKNVLIDVFEYMEKNRVKWSFGKAEGYCISKDNIISNKKFIAPMEIWPYEEGNIAKIKERILVFKDYISGATMFFERKHLTQILKRIQESVIYAEDLLQILEVLDQEKVLYIPKNLIGYEVGTGISTSQKGNPRLEKDYQNFEEYLVSCYTDEALVRRKRRDEVLRTSTKLYKYLFLVLESPRRVVTEIRKKKIKWSKKVSLGLLDEKKFYEEFSLIRG